MDAVYDIHGRDFQQESPDFPDEAYDVGKDRPDLTISIVDESTSGK